MEKAASAKLDREAEQASEVLKLREQEIAKREKFLDVTEHNSTKRAKDLRSAKPVASDMGGKKSFGEP